MKSCKGEMLILNYKQAQDKQQVMSSQAKRKFWPITKK